MYFLIIALTGVVTFLAVMLFGAPGFAALSLLSTASFFKSKRPWDEREYQMHYKASNITLGAIYLSSVALYIFGHLTLGEQTLYELSPLIIICLVLCVHGLSSFVLMREPA